MTLADLKAAATSTGAVAAPRKTLFDMIQNPRFAKGLAAVANKYLPPDRMVSLCINAVKKTPKLQECDPLSVLGAMMSSAALSLEPNTPQQQAFLIPYKISRKVGNEWVTSYDCQFQIGSRGFRTLAYRSPYIKLMTGEAIHDGDLWEHEIGSKSFLRYAKTLKDRGMLLGRFSYVQFAEGGEDACVLPFDEIMKIRSKSETYRSLVDRVATAEGAKDKARAERNLAETPWVMWEDDMAAKSATKKHAKQLPLTDSNTLTLAADLDTKNEERTIDMAAFVDPELTRAVVAGDAEIPTRQAIEHQPSEPLRFPPEDRQAQEESAGAPVTSAPAKKAATKPKQASAPPPEDQEAPKKKTYAAWADQVIKAGDADSAAVFVDQARADLPEDQLTDLGRLFDRTWGAA